MHSYCPHCRRALADVGEVDQDHVVTEALGGVETITTCKRCNSALGGGVEGRLVGPRGLLTPLSQAQGWTRGAVQGLTEDGLPMQAYFGDGRYLLTKPRAEVLGEDDQTVRLAVTWPGQLPDRQREGYLQSLAKQYGGVESDRRSGPAPARQTELGLVTDVNDLLRVTAKITLNTGAGKWGDPFTLSPLADWLRVVLDVRSDWKAPHQLPPRSEPHARGRELLPPQELARLSEQVQQQLARVLHRTSQGLPVVGHIEIPPPVTLLLPVAGGDATVVMVMVLGVVLPGLVVPHPLVPRPDPLGPELVVHPARPAQRTPASAAADSSAGSSQHEQASD